MIHKNTSTCDWSPVLRVRVPSRIVILFGERSTCSAREGCIGMGILGLKKNVHNDMTRHLKDLHIGRNP